MTSTHASLMTLALAHLSACAFADDYDRFHFTDPPGEDASVELPLECVDLHFEEALASLSFDTRDGDTSDAASCGGETAPSLLIEWEAPSAGFFRASGSGEGFEPVLALREPSCDGAERACALPAEGAASAVLPFRSQEGERHLFFVGGSGGGQGPGELTIDRPACPAIELASGAPSASYGTAAGAPYEVWSCAGDGSLNARAFRYTAEESGRFSFLLAGDDETLQVQLEEGPFCGGARAQCAGVSDPPEHFPDDHRTELIRNLDEGESVTLVAKGRSGDANFTLDVTQLPSVECADGALSMSAGAPTITTLPEDGPHRVVPSCGLSSASDYDGTVRPNPDATFTAEVEPLGPGCPPPECVVTVEAGFPFAASVSESSAPGGCPERELRCEQSEAISNDPPLFRAELALGASDSLLSLTVQRLIYPETSPPSVMFTTDDLELTVNCIGIC